MNEVLKELVEKPPARSYSVSAFGFRFLEFVATYGQNQIDGEKESAV